MCESKFTSVRVSESSVSDSDEVVSAQDRVNESPENDLLVKLMRW